MFTVLHLVKNTHLGETHDEMFLVKCQGLAFEFSSIKTGGMWRV